MHSIYKFKYTFFLLILLQSAIRKQYWRSQEEMSVRAFNVIYYTVSPKYGFNASLWGGISSDNHQNQVLRWT